MSERPLILVTNDDGIHADGLWHLAEAVQEHGEVMIVAPAFNQSGMSAAFTLHRDLEAEPAHSRFDDIPAWQVSGTPTDAVVHGLRNFAPRRVKMIVSGVNPGPNVGREILHSGTVMSAMQGYLRNLPSVAVSLASFEEQHLKDAAVIGAQIAGRLLQSGDVRFLNVNCPDLPLAEMNGVRVTATADIAISRVLDVVDDHGAVRRRLEWRLDAEIPAGSDVAAIIDGAVAVTPLDNDLTNYAALSATTDLIDGI